MHEMSLCESVLQVIETEAQKQQFSEVKRVLLEIGQLSSVELESMKFCFEVVSRNSLMEKAKLEIEHTPGVMWCMSCSNTFEASTRLQACPQCGSHQCIVSGGEEMKIKELEVI